MKKINYLLSACFVICLITGLASCSNEESGDQNLNFKSDKEKVEEMMRLFESYGWELDTTVSVEQRNKELLEMDYEKTKSFLDFMKGGFEMDSIESEENEYSQSQSPNVSSRTTMTYPIYGSHSNFLGYSAQTTMIVSYDAPSTTSVTITSTSVSSNPATTWTPDSYGTFNFSGNKCDNIRATGMLKYGSIYNHKYEMIGWVEKNSSGSLVNGKVTGFHEIASSRGISHNIQQEINDFENSYIANFSSNKVDEITMFGYKTMMLEGENKEIVKWQYKNYKKEIDDQKGIFIASDFSFYRIYFPMHTALISFENVEYAANEKGMIQLPIQRSKALNSLAITGRIKSDKVTGCGSNIITPNKIILKDALTPAEIIGNACIFNMGLIDCCESETRASVACTQNHGSYANCSDAFGIWGDNCVTRRDVCMDFNGYGSDCVKGPKTYFIGSDCQKAMLQGHCWNEIM